MTTKQQAERMDAHTMQREKERERRRLRDRLRRQNMTQEQRDKHLARRRKNYQLRRLRAQNANSLDSQQTDSDIRSPAADHKVNDCLPTSVPMVDDLPTSSEIQGGESLKFRENPRRLSVTNIRYLARRIHSDVQQKKGEVLTGCVVPTKRLRLTHVKRLARAVKLTVK